MINGLEKLAIDFCDGFLKVIRNPKNKETLKRIIGLYGAEDEILKSLKKLMNKYFEEKNEQIKIVLDEKGYDINVGNFYPK